MANNLQIGNLSASVTVADLLELFGKIGSVETASIMTNAETGLSRGMGLVSMTHAADAVTAIGQLNFTQYEGQIMSVSKDRRTGADQA